MFCGVIPVVKCHSYHHCILPCELCCTAIHLKGNVNRDAEASDARRPSRHHKKLTDQELRSMPPQLRSKYLAYEDPPKEIAEQQAVIRKRVFERMQAERQKSQLPHEEEEMERQQHEKLIGQLKAAEARNRIRITRLRYESGRASEVGQLIASQPSAVTAVRLEALLPVKKDRWTVDDPLNKISRDRVERILKDDLNLTTGRT